MTPNFWLLIPLAIAFIGYGCYINRRKRDILPPPDPKAQRDIYLQ